MKHVIHIVFVKYCTDVQYYVRYLLFNANIKTNLTRLSVHCKIVLTLDTY